MTPAASVCCLERRNGQRTRMTCIAFHFITRLLHGVLVGSGRRAAMRSGCHSHAQSNKQLWPARSHGRNMGVGIAQRGSCA